MPDFPPPVLLAVTAADVLHRDRYSGCFTLLTILNKLRVKSLPFTLTQIGVYVAVTEVTRPTRISIRLVTPQDEVIALGPDWDLPAGEPLFVHELGCDLMSVTVVEAGYHSVRVMADGDMLGEWRILVMTPKDAS